MLTNTIELRVLALSFYSQYVNPIGCLFGQSQSLNTKHSTLNLYLGGYSAEVPPLPIPNRVVKLSNADGTAFVGE